MTRSENTILMFSVILCWASTYIFIKQLPASLPNFAYLTMNFGIAAILLTIIFLTNGFDFSNLLTAGASSSSFMRYRCHPF